MKGNLRSRKKISKRKQTSLYRRTFSRWSKKATFSTSI